MAGAVGEFSVCVSFVCRSPGAFSIEGVTFLYTSTSPITVLGHNCVCYLSACNTSPSPTPMPTMTPTRYE